MTNAHARHLRSSLSDSWGDADYDSDAGASIQTASDAESLSAGEPEELSDREWTQPDTGDVPTPRPTRPARSNTYGFRDAVQLPVETARPTDRFGRSMSQLDNPNLALKVGYLASPPGSKSPEPSLIMPTMESSRSTVGNGSPGTKPRLRVRQQKPPARTPPPPPQSTTQQTTSADPWHYIHLFCIHALWPTLTYITNVSGMALQYLKPLFAMLLAIWFVTAISRSASRTIQTAISPICNLPGSSYVLPLCAHLNAATPNHAEPEFDHLMDIQSAFVDIMQENQDASSLPATMKDCENAVRDLRTVVRYSNLPSRQELGVEFTSFIEAAREASRDLINYNLKIGVTVDKIISTNRWTETRLRTLSAQEAEKGSLERALANLNPVAAFRAPRQTFNEQVFDQYLQHVLTNKGAIDALIAQSTALLGTLNDLGNRLELIHEISLRDDTTINRNLDDLLSQLWTKLGGNKATRKEYDRQLSLLKDVTRYRKAAITHVSATLLKLESIAAGLEDLREQVAAPEALGYRADVPIEQYIELVEQATDRLQDVRGQVKSSEQAQRRTALQGGGEEPIALPGPGKKAGFSNEQPVVYARMKGATRK